MRQTVLPGLDQSRAGDPGLVVRGPSGRFAALLEQNRRLLRKVTLKRRALGRLRDELREHGVRAAARLEPVSERLRALDAELHQLFTDLLKSRKITKRDRREVQALYQLLQSQEVISPRSPADEPRWAVDDEPPGPEPLDDLPSAPRPSDAEGKGTLRELFLRLAHALHPDRAPESEDAADRTEAMKDVNRAYRDGDLARLLEIERTWAVARVVAGASREGLDRRVQELERTNQALAAQLKVLEREHRELKRSDLARLAGGPKAGGHALEELAREAEAEVTRLQQLRDHVKAFRNGEISADAFFLGTDGAQDDDGPLGGMTMEEALDFMAGWTEPPAPAPPRGRGKRPPGRKRRQRGR